MFKTIRIYIKLQRDFVEIINLETGQAAAQRAMVSFSSERNVVSSFNHAKDAIVAVLRELGIKPSFWGPSLQVLIQQLEGTEGGLSDIEKRALLDLGEMIGGRKVYVIRDSKPLSGSEALLHFG
jgi:hypothetical protein